MFDIRMRLLGHMIRLPVEFFDKNPVGRLVTRATNDISAINEMFTSVLIYVFKDVFLIVGIIFIMGRMNLRLTGIIFVLVPIIAYIAWEFRKRKRKNTRAIFLTPERSRPLMAIRDFFSSLPRADWGAMYSSPTFLKTSG